MAKKKSKNSDTITEQISDYRFEQKRKYITPAGLAAQGVNEPVPKQKFFYDPHLPPVLRFDGTGASDKLPELLEKAKKEVLSSDEIKVLAAALKKHEPWLEWSGKREKKYFEVDPVALHIHERVSTQAILKVAKREPVQRELFADPEMEYREAIKFYKYDMDWANRLILGDSLQVMASLAYRENLAGQVQMIYFDPPYGIKFNSNFQSEVGKRDVKDQDNDLTREPEVIKAYRDTWTLGIHSYLSYIRDRLILSKKLLKNTGSIFVQIGKENPHIVRDLLDEVFGKNNFISEIVFRKTGGQSNDLIAVNFDTILWYAKSKEDVRYTQLYIQKMDEDTTSGYDYALFDNGERRKIREEEELEENSIERFQPTSIVGDTPAVSTTFPFIVNGNNVEARSWKTNQVGLKRLILSERIDVFGKTPRYIRLLKDFKVKLMTSLWADTMGERRIDYVVQTAAKVIERCLLMASEPGDLILDPTCGSGTTAFVSEQRGRRWITIDTSRVAISLARQRLLTSRFEHYKTEKPDEPLSESNKFIYEKVSHITLKSIAQNLALDPIFSKYEPLLIEKLTTLNKLLKKVNQSVRDKLTAKLLAKQKTEGKKSITEADNRRWNLPSEKFEHWTVPFEADVDYPADLKKAVNEYRQVWKSKMKEVNSCIEANAEQVDLVDNPNKENKTIRVSGPFTVEGVMPAELNAVDISPIIETKGELETFSSDGADVATNAVSFLDNVLNLLRREGLDFLGNKKIKFERIEWYDKGEGVIHYEGEYINGGNKSRRIAISIGPQYGSITGWQVENASRIAFRHGFDDVVFAGFSFTAEATATIDESSNPKVKFHMAQIGNDVHMGDLLKSTGTGQLFTVFGSPRVKLNKGKDEQFSVVMEGVDIYDPIANILVPTKAEKVTAWFLDSDYDGRTFCITQAFFPDRDAWKKLEKALKGIIDEEKFEAFSGTTSLPFPIGEQKRIAVKVIDPRGNEVMKVMSLDKKY